MTEAPRTRITIEQNAEYNEIRTELAKQLDATKVYKYSNIFLNHYETKKPEEYAALKALTEATNPTNEALNTALVKLDEELAKLDGVRKTGEITRIFKDNGVELASVEIDPDDNLLVATVDCPGGAPLEIVQDNASSFMVDGVPYNADLEEIAEDVKIIVKTFKEIVTGNLAAENNNPFSISKTATQLLQFNGKPLHNGLQNTFEAKDPKALVDMLNERYAQMTFGTSPAKEPAAESTVAAAAPTVEPMNEAAAWAASYLREVDGEVVPIEGYAWADPDSEDNWAIVPIAAEAPVESGVASAGSTAIPSAPVAAPTAPAEAPVAAAPATAVAASIEAAPTINSEAEFLASIQGEKYNRLANLTEDDTTGSITITIPKKHSPDYLYSRIHHFLGKGGAVKNLANPENYTVNINGQEAEWKTTSAYPGGTWVATGTNNRILVKEGNTKIEWTKKVETATPSVVAAAVEATVSTDVPEVIVTNLDSEALKIEKLNAEAKDLVAKDIGIMDDQKVANSALESVISAKKGLFQTEKTRLANLENAQNQYKVTMDALKMQKGSLAQKYTTLLAKLDSVDPAVFDDNPQYANTKKVAEYLASLKNGNGIDSLETRIASLTAPTKAPSTEDTAVADAGTANAAPADGAA